MEMSEPKTSDRIAPYTHCMGYWLDRRGGLNKMMKRIKFAYKGNRIPAVQPLCSSYTKLFLFNMAYI
jgi:Zn-finger nucleic acid-binding protein